MKRQAYQHPELRDANDNIIQAGTYGKTSPLVNSTNDGVLDYINNNLEALHDNINGSRIYVANKDALPAMGDLSAMYIAEDTGKWYLWDGQKYIETDNARKIADEAIAARDAAKASQAAAKTSEQNAKTSETNAAASAKAAATSAGAAKTSENNAGTQANTAKAWATATTSPDGAADTSSTTGKTQSAKSWALYSKDRATASASSASAAATSAGAAKTSEQNANASKTAAATSASNAANSAKAAASSATAAADSARVNQADWNVTDSTSMAFIKNKPEVYPKAAKVESEAPVDTPTDLVYAKCGTSDRFRIRVGGAENAGWVELATGDDAEEPIYVRQYAWADNAEVDPYFGHIMREAALLDASGNTYFPGTVTAPTFSGLASKATADAAGNNIQTTYAKKSDLASSLSTKALTVTGETSVPTANAGNSSNAIASTEFVAKSIASLVGSAPDQLNTLNELAKALGNDANFSATITAELAKKLNSAEAESTYATKTEAGVLPGTVTAFSGTFKDGFPVDKNTGLVNREWHLCDGTNGTPDLRNRFIYGGSGTNNGATGGEATHKLTEAELPVFTPSFDGGGTALVVHNTKHTDTKNGFTDGGMWGDMPKTIEAPFNTIGGNQPHNNMPPYYVLAYIMKL